MIIDKLNDILNGNDHGSTAYTISAYVKAHILEMGRLTAEEVARGCFVSKGQMSKYVKALGFDHYYEFRDACVEYCVSRKQRSRIFSPERTLRENSARFLEELTAVLKAVQKNLDDSKLEKLVCDICKSENIYLYARGDTRFFCNFMQVEFSTFFKNVLICDNDFKTAYHFKEKDLLIMLSVSGRSFLYARNKTDRVEQAAVSKWLITCQDALKFAGNRLLVPVQNQLYQEYAMRYVIDLMISQLQIRLAETSW